MAKDVGAKKVIVASCAPPIRYFAFSVSAFPDFSCLARYPNVYGIDMPSRKELVAHGRDEEHIAEAIGADLVIFQTLPDLIESVRQLNPEIGNFDCSVFSGEYVTGGVDEAYLQHLESLRADNIRGKAPNLDLDALDKKGVNGSSREGNSTGASTPVNGSDTVGLHNSWNTN